jgi:hypothetical protein
VIHFIDSQARKLEETAAGPLAAAATFAAIVMARHVLEILAGQNPVYYPIQFYIHYALAYVAPFLALVLVLHLFAAVPLLRVARLMLYVWSLTLLPPLVDLLVGRGGEAIGYLRPGRHGVSVLFLRFLDPTAEFAGTTPGIRVETAIACLLGAAYVIIRGRGQRSTGTLVMASAGAFIGVYLTALGFFTLPRLFEAAMERLAGWDLAALYAHPVYAHLPEPLGLAIIDRLYVIYLVPLCLVLAGVCALRATASRMAPTTWLRISAGGLVAAATTTLGLILSVITRRTLEPATAPAAPVDLLTAGALILAAVMVPPAARLLAGTTQPVRMAGAILAASSGILAACSGASTLALLVAALFLHLIRHLPPLQLEQRQPGGALAAGVAGLALFGAGMSWALGQEALMLIPHSMSLGLIAGLALAALAAGLAGQQRTPPRLRGYAPLLLLPAALATVSLGFDAPLMIVLPALAALLAALLPRLLGRPQPLLETVSWALALSLTGAGTLADMPATAALTAETTTRPRFLIRRGMLAEEEQRFAEAAALYRQALQREPDRGPVLARLAEILYVHLDRADEAVPALRRALELEPDNISSLGQLATIVRQARSRLRLLQDDRPGRETP